MVRAKITEQLTEMLILFSELNMEFFEHKLRAITALCVINLVIGVILIVLFGLAVKRISDFFDKMTQESFHVIKIFVFIHKVLDI